jgi:hypothetical protein
VDSINKAIRDAMQEHNTTFLDAFDNTMKEVFRGWARPAYFSIPHPSTQGTMQAGTGHQGAAQTRGSDVQGAQHGQSHGITTQQMQHNPRLSAQHVQQSMGKVRIK